MLCVRAGDCHDIADVGFIHGQNVIIIVVILGTNLSGIMFGKGDVHSCQHFLCFGINAGMMIPPCASINSASGYAFFITLAPQSTLFNIVAPIK